MKRQALVQYVKQISHVRYIHISNIDHAGVTGSILPNIVTLWFDVTSVCIHAVIHSYFSYNVFYSNKNSSNKKLRSSQNNFKIEVI